MTSADRPAPPTATPRPHEVTHHGRTRPDEYAWLRDRTDPAVRELLEAENRWTHEATATTAALRAALFAEFRGRIKETDSTAPVRQGQWWYLTRTEEGKQYPQVCRRAGGPDGPEEVVLDLNLLAEGHDYLDAETDISPGGRWLAYSVDTDGSEVFEIRFRDLDSGADLVDVVENTYYGTAWVGDGDALWYVRPDDAMRPYQVWAHRMGTAATEDALVFEETDERFFVSLGLTRDDRWVEIDVESKTSSEVWLADASGPSPELTVVERRAEGVEYQIDVQGERLLVVTNADGATDFKVMEAPLATPSRANWVDLVPHRPGVKVEAVVAFERHVVRLDRRDGLRRLVVTGPDGAERAIEQPEEVYTLGGIQGDYHHGPVRYHYASMVTPSSEIDLDPATGTTTVVKELPVLGGYDRSRYETRRLWAPAPDGALVPVSVVHRRGIDLDSSHPCLLYGYGSYEYSIEPGFSSLRVSLLERGVIFAIAHVRGGGELGRPWYEQGRLDRKPATFSDFIACAEHLVGSGYTAPDRLAIRGGSAGGLLIGAVLNMRPDLFRAAVAEVPFVDALNTILDPTLPLTVTEWEEWGNPLDDPAIYDVMASYSPYDNVRDAPYPAILATAGLNDPRVSYWEPAKWVQRLRRHTTSGRPVLLKVELGAGHGGPSGRYEAWADEAFVMAFILDQIGAAG